MPENAIRIEGLRELERAFKVYGRGMEKGVREALEAGAEVVRPDVESLAEQTIKRSAIDWTRMRVGVVRRVGYVAPIQRGNRSLRSSRRARGAKFKARMLEHAMYPALDQNIDRVEREFEDALGDLARLWSRV